MNKKIALVLGVVVAGFAITALSIRVEESNEITSRSEDEKRILEKRDLENSREPQLFDGGGRSTQTPKTRREVVDESKINLFRDRLGRLSKEFEGNSLTESYRKLLVRAAQSMTSEELRAFLPDIFAVAPDMAIYGAIPQIVSTIGNAPESSYLSWVKDNEDGPFSKVMFGSMAAMFGIDGNREAAESLISALGGEVKKAAGVSYVMSIALNDGVYATSYLRESGMLNSLSSQQISRFLLSMGEETEFENLKPLDVGVSEKKAETWAYGLYRSWASHRPEEAWKALSGEKVGRLAAQNGIIESWYASDFNAVASALQEMDPSLERDHAFANFASLSTNRDPETAREWADAINSDELRQKAMNNFSKSK